MAPRPERELGTGEVVRFADPVALFEHFGAADVDAFVEIIDDEVDSYVDLLWMPDGLELQMTTPNLVRTSGLLLEFPMTLGEFWDCVHDLDHEVVGE
jgi:hypothetical protein